MAAKKIPKFNQLIFKPLNPDSGWMMSGFDTGNVRLRVLEVT
jgi:hypothetical protein